MGGLDEGLRRVEKPSPRLIVGQPVPVEDLLHTGHETGEDRQEIVLMPAHLSRELAVGETRARGQPATLGKCDGAAGYLSDADYDGDGCVTYADFRIWMGHFRNQ